MKYSLHKNSGNRFLQKKSDLAILKFPHLFVIPNRENGFPIRGKGWHNSIKLFTFTALFVHSFCSRTIDKRALSMILRLRVLIIT